MTSGSPSRDVVVCLELETDSWEEVGIKIASEVVCSCGQSIATSLASIEVVLASLGKMGIGMEIRKRISRRGV